MFFSLSSAPQYLVIFWAFTYIGAWFNGLTVIILLYLGAFSLPLLYEQNRPLIDQYLELANSKITEISDKYAASVHHITTFLLITHLLIYSQSSLSKKGRRCCAR